MVAKGEEGGSGMDEEFGVSRCKPLHLEWISNGVLLYSTGNYIQFPGIDHVENNIKKEDVYICMIHFAVQQKLAQQCKLTIL